MCPTWFVAVTDDNVTTCKCGSDLERQVFAIQTVRVLHGYCMTRWNSMTMTVVDKCPYNMPIYNYFRNSPFTLRYPTTCRA